MQTTTVTAPDIECQGCANSIKKALGNIPGVARIDVDIASKVVSVQHDETTPATAITAALDKAGFPVA